MDQGSSTRPGTGSFIKILACAGGAGQSRSGQTGSFWGPGPAGPEEINKCLRGNFGYSSCQGSEQPCLAEEAGGVGKGEGEAGAQYPAWLSPPHHHGLCSLTVSECWQPFPARGPVSHTHTNTRTRSSSL